MNFENIAPSTLSLFFLISILFIILIFYLLHKSKTNLLSQRINDMNDQKNLLYNELLQERELLKNSNSEKEELKIQLSSSHSDLKNLQIRFDEYLNDANSMQEKFENLANKVLESKSKKFDQEQKKTLENVLNPLREKIKTFEEKVESTNKESIERHSSLKTQISTLKELNEKMTSEASNLTRALKGDSRTQGNWGELILESILEKSGLEKDREYFIQPSFTNEDGRRLRPDVIIHLPDGKKIIIDSKVSIRAYEQFVNSTEEEEQQDMLKAHILSVKTHIEELSAKNYHDIYKIESPDFVLMFVPIDTAFAVAESTNQNLYSYAFDKNIVIVTPATLLATLKTVDTMWKNEKQQRHAVEIAEEAGKMYDKFAGLVDDLIRLGRRIDQTKEHYQESMKKLHYGTGDLITRAEKLKKLGVKVKKEIPQELIERSKETND